ncbi:MAG TPA: DUF3987 domain-containing protein [Thermoanaerobaculia bacterium]|nr:DUF3987 domain-containing protein [Thermoanaerobaculia bacterium]
MPLPVAAGVSVKLRSQTVAGPATKAAGGEVSQLSQSQPEKFPIEALPWHVYYFVLEASNALDVDPALIAGPCLATLAGCIGNRRKIELKPDSWSEACVLWVATVMPSGSKKTPAINLVLHHLQESEVAALSENAEKIEKWKALPKDERGEEPEPPNRLLVSDITTEGLLAVHAKAPMGLLLYRDELGGWLKGFDQYKSGKGADAQTWTEMYQGNPCLIDRKGSGTLSVPRAAVSIVGGIQPELLRNALSGEHLYNGIASRVLFVAVPERPKKWNNELISDDSRKEWNNLLDELLELQPHQDGTPIDLPMTDKATIAWVNNYDEHAQREAEEDGPLRAAMSKLEGATARLALVIQLAEDPQSVAVDAEAMEAGIAISNWFEGQARRIYQGFEETAQERDRREVYGWIVRRGGSTTQRDLANGGPYRFRKRAGEVLADLVAAGLAERSQQSGRRADLYTLCDCDSCDGETP